MTSPFDALCTPQRYFEHFQTRWATALRLPPHERCLDDELVPTLKLINRCAGLSTVFSCASHPERAEYRLYILIALRPEGLSAVMDVFGQLQARLDRPDSPTSSAIARLGFGKYRHGWTRSKKVYYSAVSLSFTFPPSKTVSELIALKAYVIAELEQAFTNHLPTGN
jgi:hypothetical protein